MNQTFATKCLLLSFVCILFTQGCVTQKKCLSKFPPAVDTITTVILRDSVVYRDTVIFVRIPGRVIIDTVVIPCPPPPPEYIPDTAKAETEYSRAIAWWDYPSIRLELENKPLNLRFQLDSALMDAYHWKEETTRIREVMRVKYTPKWVSYLAGFGGFVIALLIGKLLAKFKLI